MVHGKTTDDLHTDDMQVHTSDIRMAYEPFKNYEKCFLLHLETSFRCRDLQILEIFPFLSMLFRFKRTNESGRIFDVMNWLV